MSQTQVPIQGNPQAATIEQPNETSAATMPPVASTTTVPEQAITAPASAPSTPAEHALHGSLIGRRATATRRSLSGWWHALPAGGRRAITQVLFTLVVLLLLLPLASLTGLLHFGSAPSAAGGSGAGTTSTAAAPTANPAKAPAHPVYNAQPPASPSGDTVQLNLVAKEALIAIAPGVAYHAWTFNGAVPGPILRVRQGQTVHFTLTNDSGMPHSIDFHAAQTPWSVNYQPVAPGKSFSFTWKANYPGIFMYHCGTPPAMVHMANGMYGAIIVDPANGWPSPTSVAGAPTSTGPVQEYVLVQSEFYTKVGADGIAALDGASMMTGMPNYVVFNGYVNQYKQAPLTAKAGQPIRLFVVNAGPSQFSAFHVIGAIFSDTYVDGNPANHLVGDQTVTIPPGGGAVVELTMPEAGLYPFLTHSFSAADMGALGILKITQ